MLLPRMVPIFHPDIRRRKVANTTETAVEGSFWAVSTYNVILAMPRVSLKQIRTGLLRKRSIALLTLACLELAGLLTDLDDLALPLFPTMGF